MPDTAPQAGPLGGVGLDTRWLEAASGAIAVLWAATVLADPQQLLSHPGYQPLARFAPDWMWAALALAGGAIQVIVVRRDHIEARPIVAMAMGAIWLLLADGLRMGAPWSPSIALYGGLGLANAACMLVLGYLWQRARAVRRP